MPRVAYKVGLATCRMQDETMQRTGMRPATFGTAELHAALYSSRSQAWLMSYAPRTTTAPGLASCCFYCSLLVACLCRPASTVPYVIPRKPHARPQRRRRCTREAARLNRAEPVHRALSGHERCKLQGLVHLEIACRKDSDGQSITERHWLLVRQISLPIGQNGWAVDSRQTRGLAYATEFGWEFESTSERQRRAANPPRWSSNPP